MRIRISNYNLAILLYDKIVRPLCRFAKVGSGFYLMEAEEEYKECSKIQKDEYYLIKIKE